MCYVNVSQLVVVNQLFPSGSLSQAYMCNDTSKSSSRLTLVSCSAGAFQKPRERVVAHGLQPLFIPVACLPPDMFTQVALQPSFFPKREILIAIFLLHRKLQK